MPRASRARSDPRDRARPPRADDGEPIERVLGGETQASEVLLRRHNQRLFRVVRAILRDDAEAEDTVQRRTDLSDAPTLHPPAETGMESVEAERSLTGA